jgi:hypothetical protein
MLLTVLTVLTVFSSGLRIVIILFPARPSRLNVISMPRIRRKVCARRSRPARARGFLGQPVPSRDVPLLLQPTPRCMRSTALPVHNLRSAMISHTQAATGSASMAHSIAALRLPHRRSRRCQQATGPVRRLLPRARNRPSVADDPGQAPVNAPTGAPSNRGGRRELGCDFA